MARETVVLIYNSQNNSLSLHRISLHGLHNLPYDWTVRFGCKSTGRPILSSDFFSPDRVHHPASRSGLSSDPARSSAYG